MNCSSRSIVSRYIAFGHVGHGFGRRHRRKPVRTLEELTRLRAEAEATLRNAQDTRRMIEQRNAWSRQANGPF